MQKQARTRHFTRIARLLELVLAGLAMIGAARAGTTSEVANFGSNPGDLRMFKHIPDGIPATPPLIVVLHGCTQNARDYATAAGWMQVAEALRVPLVMPEQRPGNNFNRCFNWFVRGDNRRGQGEAASIRQMVEKMRLDHGIDVARVFVTGLSAGGAMTAVMLATYPDVFAGGGVVAGLPYGCASDPAPTQPTQALQCMNTGRAGSPLIGLPGSVGSFIVPLPPAVCQMVPFPIPGCAAEGEPPAATEWGELVRRASSHTGPFPRISIWHGAADATVNVVNAEELVEQWVSVHGLDAAQAMRDTVHGHARRQFRDGAGRAMVEFVRVNGMGHGVPVDPGSGAEQCGTATAFVLDAHVCSSLFIARFWGLAN